ncbi:MAG: beta-ketoacyl-[acyl-carrier-protein] synthase family protein [Desulfuromonadaceae bacterium]|nr:beta-ketoacyl-[acyl-carrier-protein] synthase family protein [Desulfuromonadaceae bacterium]
MTLKRVVITGYGAVSPYGRGVESLMDGLLRGLSTVRYQPGLESLQGLRTRVGATVPSLDEKEIPRHFRRSMSKLSIYAALAATDALQQAGVDAALCASGRVGVAAGSTLASTTVTENFFADYLCDHSIERMKSTLFFQLMNHTCASNLAQVFGIRGRLLAPSAACATSSQALGYGCEMIAAGHQDLMLCGGADEFHPLSCATFDILNAASTAYNDRPDQTPRPFCADRDGMVCAEGAGILVLECLDSARRRGVPILAEILGFASCCDPGSIANPDAAVMESCMRQALQQAQLEPAAVGYVNAHATGTEQGDVAEAQAIGRVFGSSTPVSSLKGHMGHTLAACGALETIATVEMMRQAKLVPTLNLSRPDERCPALDYLVSPRQQGCEVAMKNNFALGGVNTSLVLRRTEDD